MYLIYKNQYTQAVGIVASVGDSVRHIKVGTAVALMTFGSYAEFTVVLQSMYFCYRRNYHLICALF